MGDMQTQIDYPKGLDFEQVWAALMENREQIKDTERLLKETIAASEKDRAENEKDRAEREKERAEREKDRAEYNKRFGDMDNRFGEVVENLLAPTMIDRFIDLGVVFQTASTNVKVKDHKNKIYFEIDVFLQNSDTSMLVEIKTNLSINYINEHITRLEKMRSFADLHNDKRAFLGAVAGIVVPLKVRNYALENGLYLIEPAGENLIITPPPNKPKVW